MSCGDPHEVDCRDVLAEVYVYLDLEIIDDSERDRIREHLDECSPCLREFGIEQEVKVLVARCCGGEHAPPDLKQRLRVRLQELVRGADAREFLAE